MHRQLVVRVSAIDTGVIPQQHCAGRFLEFKLFVCVKSWCVVSRAAARVREHVFAERPYISDALEVGDGAVYRHKFADAERDWAAVADANDFLYPPLGVAQRAAEHFLVWVQ